ncbi:MAG: hypothetical protein MUO22_02030 [Sedimentisphaerales bacterium]|nr:hypothetical protein [Sedimentisphaerales bacterium]
METILMHKRTSIIGTVLTTLFSLLILYNVSYGNNGSIQSMPESEYVDFLDVAVALTKANYEKISSWQGKISIQENDYYYGKKCRLLPIDANDPAANSVTIRRSVSASVEFATDVQNNKLYTELIPKVKYKALDLDRDVVVKERYSPILSIVTSDEYLSYKPNHNYAYDRDTIINGKWVGRKAFRMPVEKVKGEQWGHVRDPRRYFFPDNKPVWEDLYALSNVITNPSDDIPMGKAPQISIAIEEMGDHIKTHIKAGFYGSPNCTNCENEFVYIIMTLDSSVELNLIRREVTDKTGKTLQILDIIYEEINGIYVPKSVHFVIFNPSEQKLFDSWITFTKSILNLPISPEKFSYSNLGLKDGDRFIDEILGKEHTYQNGTLIPVTKKK